MLVVDDRTETLAVCRRLLEDVGHRVVVARDAAEALEVLADHPIDLVLTELVLPGPHGDALIRAIRARDVDVAIVVQTDRDAAHPPREMVRRLPIQGWHDKADGPERLLCWIEAALQTRDRVAALREAERGKGELLASVSHEFRTPLNVILGYLDLVRDGTFGACAPDALEALRKVTGNAAHLLELVEEFLDTARLEAAHGGVTSEIVPIDALLAELAEPFTVLLRERPIALRTRVVSGVPGVVADAARLRIVLQNLLGNAAKFTREGWIEIAAEPHGQDAVAIHVTDTGPGFGPEEGERIFEPFRQLGTPAVGSGIGLGLALARRFARLMGGDLTASGTPGVGARFTLVLPAAAGSAAAALG
ncbi:MAG: response regulator [bacterium]|nr:response regulator [bacterium]